MSLFSGGDAERLLHLLHLHTYYIYIGLTLHVIAFTVNLACPFFLGGDAERLLHLLPLHAPRAGRRLQVHLAPDALPQVYGPPEAQGPCAGLQAPRLDSPSYYI